MRANGVDLLAPAAVATALGNLEPDEIYYLAAFHHASEDEIENSATDLERRSFDVHVTGLRNVLKALQAFLKTHGAEGIFDLDLMPLSTAGVECRSSVAGVHQMVVQFANPVTVGGATAFSGTGAVSGFVVSGSTVTVDLTGVVNAQTLVMKLTGVNDGTFSGDVPVAMSVLLGDTTGNGVVNATDIVQVKSQSGQSTTASNFWADVNASGSINASDIGLVRSASGTTLP